MNRKILVSISFFIYTTHLLAQDVKFSLQTGYGFYDMSSLSTITNDAVHLLPFEAKIVSNYPAYNYYQPMVKFCFDNVEFGFSYTFQTTGSRISSKDYSGEYKLDTKVNGNSLGLFLGTTHWDSCGFNFGYFLQMGINLSTFKINEFLQTGTAINNTDYKYTANSFYFEPGVNVTYHFNKRLSVSADLAYYKEFIRNDFELSGASENKIQVKKDFGDSDMWDGFRLGLTLSYILFK